MTEHSALPSEYDATLRSIRHRVTVTRSRAQLAANAQLVHLYRAIGSILLERTRTAPGGPVS
ncbi:hypothetical protein ACRQ4B_15390 [Curtobacterium sp. SP.BCo]|uniref:hypothetical protein n=1 Tax=Curtobacterium sp. SP.BCo TaxID=3435229 RepID=UPI003F740F73